MNVANVPVQPHAAPTGAPRVADIVDIDLSRPESFEAGVPHDAFDRLREGAPIAWHDEHRSGFSLQSGSAKDAPRSPGFWAVTSHELVNEVSRNPASFSSWVGGTQLHNFAEADLLLFRQMMINMDPPEHSRLRRILQPTMTPRAIQRLRDDVERHAREIVDDLEVAGGGDFVVAASAELPIRVLADFLGVPREDRHRILSWSNALVGADDPEYGSSRETVIATMMDLFAYGQSIAEDRRSTPRDDIVSMIANAEVDGERLTDSEFNVFWLLLIIAGNETTRNSLSGGLAALCEQGKWGWLRDNRESLSSAVEELIRFVSPVMQFRRTATHDAALGGQMVRAGDKVVVWYGAANRDPSVFVSPHLLDLVRDPNPHLAFGVGPHFCLGAHLARLEMSVMLDEMLRRFGSITIDGPVERMRSNFINGIRHLPIRCSSAG